MGGAIPIVIYERRVTTRAALAPRPGPAARSGPALAAPGLRGSESMKRVPPPGRSASVSGAAHALGELAADREPEPEAALRAAAAAAVEALEDPLALLRSARPGRGRRPRRWPRRAPSAAVTRIGSPPP